MCVTDGWLLVKSLHKRPWLGAEPVSGTNITSIIKPGHPAAAKQRASARCFCVSCAVAAVFVVACRKRRHGECECQDETNDDEFLFRGFFPKVVKIMIYQFSRAVNKDIFVPRRESPAARFSVVFQDMSDMPDGCAGQAPTPQASAPAFRRGRTAFSEGAARFVIIRAEGSYISVNRNGGVYGQIRPLSRHCHTHGRGRLCRRRRSRPHGQIHPHQAVYGEARRRRHRE